MNMHLSVKRFHECTLIPVGHVPYIPLSVDRLRLRLKLFDEFFELLEASGVSRERIVQFKMLLEVSVSEIDGTNQNIVEQADALGDIVVVAFGMAIEMGINLNRVLDEIMRANMSKLDEDGKPLINRCVVDGCFPDNCRDTTHYCKPDDPHGKVLKASGYTPPDVRRVLDSQPPLN